MGSGSPDCKTKVDESLAKGECARLKKGTPATIEAGSHSFDWVRILVPGQPQPLWTQRSLVLE
jgi:hypothetical protein